MTRAPSKLATVAAVCVALAAPSVHAAPGPKKPRAAKPRAKKPKSATPKATKPKAGAVSRGLDRRLGGERPTLDADSLLGLNLSKAPIRKGAPSAFRSASVEVAGGARVKIGDITGESKHKAFRKKLGKLPKGAVFGAVKQNAEVYEFDDSFVVITSTGATVADPKAVKKALPTFGKLAKSGSVHVDMSKLTAESEAGLARFKAEVATYPAGHPLKKAAAKGDQALLDAMASGVGFVEVVHTLHVPKKPPKVKGGSLEIPKVVGGHVDYSKTKTIKRKTVVKPGKPIGIDAPATGSVLPPAVPVSSTGPVTTGGRNQSAEFVAGRTWGEGWVWEERWNVPSGFLRITLGAHYAVGLRVPIEVKTEMTPTWVCDEGPSREGRTGSFRLKVKAEAIDGDAAFYRRAGMPEELIAGGDELAIQAGVGYGVKLRLFWKTLVNRPYREIGIDWGRDFDPPQGTESETVTEVFLPSSVTQTGFNYGPLSGYARLGFRVDVRGKVRTRVSATQVQQPLLVLTRPSGSTPVAGDVRSTPQRLVLSNTAWKQYAFRLNNSTRPAPIPSYSQSFGTTIDQVEYDSRWSVTPGVKVRASASYAGYGINGTWTYWLDDLELPIGSLRLGHHPGTRTSLRSARGRKLFKRGGSGWCLQNNPNV